MNTNGTACDIIIPVFNRPDLTKRCLESIYANTAINFRIILIDNNSHAETKRFLENFASEHKNCLLVKNEENLGWVKAVNRGMAMSGAPYILLMNNDTAVKTSGWLSRLIHVAELAADIGLVNPHFNAKKESLSGGSFIETDFCRGYCMLIKRAVIDRIGLLDESYGMGYYDDDDYSVRAIRALFRCVRANDVFVEHTGDSTFSKLFSEPKRLALHEKNKALFYSRWGRRLRLAFILTKDVDRSAASGLLFSLARRQHIIYLWNFGEPFLLRHINIREKRPLLGSYYPVLFNLFLNRIKRQAKRYDMIFADNERMKASASKVVNNSHYFNRIKDTGRILDLVDLESKNL